MIKKILLLLCLVLLGSSRIFAAIDNKDVNITVGSDERVYKLYVPDSFTSTSDPVLIFSLHGANCSRNSGRPDFDAVADQKGCVVVYPQGLTQNYYLLNIQGTGWDATGQSNKDLDYLKAIIEDVAQYYTAKGKTLNRKRIYCCGFSNGGMMTYSNSNTASDIFAAFASISGFPVNEYHLRHSGARPVPFLHIHGGADDFVNVAWYPTVRDIMVARNGCNPVPTETSGSAATNGTSTTYKKYEYAASEGGFPYIYYNVADMGHSDNCTIGGKSSSMVMYEFMTQYTLDSECDKTLKWKEQVDYSGYYPQNHGWNIESSSSLSYGTSQAANNADHNVYYDIQLEAGNYELRVKTSGTTGDKMTFMLETVGGTSVVNQEVTVGADASIAFTTSAYAQYKLTFTKGNTDDKLLSAAIHQAQDHSGTDTPSVESAATDLTASLFHEWTGVDGDATVKAENGGGACVLGEATGLPYGHGNVLMNNYADLSAYGKLVVTTTSGEPRFCFNRQPNDNDVLELEFPRDKESKPYEAVTTNADGSKSYTIDLDAIVKEYGYAHLNAIKGAYWTDVTVTSMKLYPSLDINRDGRVTILDVVYLIEMLNGKVTLNGRQNVNGDTLFDATDVSALGGHLLEK